MKAVFGIVVVSLLALSSMAVAQDKKNCDDQITKQFAQDWDPQYNVTSITQTDMPGKYIIHYHYFDIFGSTMIKVDKSTCKVMDWNLQ